MKPTDTIPPPAYDAETERALRLFVVLARSLSSVAEYARRHITENELSVSEFGVLELLYHKGPTPQKAIADKVLLTTGSITYVVDQLVKQGLVERISCPNDRRVIYAQLTDAGREKIARIFPEHAALLRQALSGLSREEQETLLPLLKKLGLSAQAAQQDSSTRQER